MKETCLGEGRGRTRWRRFAVALAPATAIVLATMVLMSTGALALPVSLSGTTFTVKATNLTMPQGSGAAAFQQYVSIDTLSNGTKVPVAITVLRGAVLSNLEQSVCLGTGLPGPASHAVLVITSNPATATSLVVDATHLGGDAVFKNMQIGTSVVDQRTGTVTFGDVADSVSIAGLQQTAVYTSAGTFELRGLGVHVDLAASCPR